MTPRSTTKEEETMIKLATAQLWVDDQDEALAFYTQKVGMEVKADVTVPAEQVRTLMSKGFAGTVFLTTDDCRASFDELRGRGVEFSEEPQDQPYGIDSAFRDPSGNHVRLTQVRELAQV
jgi:predicted enzyme related to lactoylglutathione lyase